MATSFAALTDVAAVPFLSDKGRAAYQRFLTSNPPRAFVIAPNGAVVLQTGGYDPLGYALERCKPCQAYAVNDDVVWTGAKAAADGGVRRVAKKVAKDAATLLGAFFNADGDCASRGLSQIAIVEAPAHGVADVGPRDAHPAFPGTSPLAKCNSLAIPAIGVTYTPAAGYTGADTLAIAETKVSGQRQSYQIDLTVQ